MNAAVIMVLQGSYGSWWSDLGLYSLEGWTEFYNAWRGVPVPD
jgi:hypothetical protein